MGLKDKIKDALHGDDRDEYADTTTHGHTSTTGAYPNDDTKLHKTDPRTHNHGLSSHDPNYRHQPTDSGVGLHDRSHRDNINTNTSTTTTTATAAGQNDPYWGAVGRDDPSRVGHNDSSSLNRKDLPLRPGEQTSGAYGSTGYGNTSTNAGPHDSNVANKVDPRVDSDRDNRGAYGTSGTAHGTTAHTNTGYGGTSGTGYGDTTNRGYGNTATTAGPHKSNVANKLDPRTASGDNYQRGGGVPQSSMLDTHSSPVGAQGGLGTTRAGPHDSNMGNKLDPRVDSDLDGRRANQLGGVGGGPGGLQGGQYGTGHTGSGVGGAGLSGAGLSGAGLTGAGVGAGSGSVGAGSAGLGADHYGPAHEGAKVFHKCRGCGMDNDISQYFRKDAVYRMG
ncbi:conserved hypothetical protein [Verticillium alfalfae VaMs.102]|uniref:Cell surface protein n=1 Tax=Verticillium alfalfae (strain VaMs.102 / ATCC MYA-4576 / FGSC 10136) TaxID=526221 RepID=C9SA13_VERA1|nr:conserved hypothetical protein [Verticillium alfalfae VaMs.102]EEY16226.1 conserved hypothetical protein [Verticillium alfalfae VaMs.102]